MGEVSVAVDVDTKVFEDSYSLHVSGVEKPHNIVLATVDWENFAFAQVKFETRDKVVFSNFLKDLDDTIDLVSLEN